MLGLGMRLGLGLVLGLVLVGPLKFTCPELELRDGK